LYSSINPTLSEEEDHVRSSGLIIGTQFHETVLNSAHFTDTLKLGMKPAQGGGQTRVQSLENLRDSSDYVYH